MNIALVGKWSNAWGAEYLVKRGFEALGHCVTSYPLENAALLRARHVPVHITIVMQGYGLTSAALEAWRHMTGTPVCLWHGEVLSAQWPTTDTIVQAKAAELAPNITAYDIVLHNCMSALDTVRALGAKRVAWCPVNGVDAERHKRLPVEKTCDVGVYGWLSPRRIHWLQRLRDAGLEMTYVSPDQGVYGEPLTEFINTCRVMLNIHYSQTRNVECRMYEALGCGVPVVSEGLSMPEIFPAGYGVLYADTPAMMVAQVNRVLSLPEDEYGGMAEAGYRLVHGSYTYTQRCALFLQTVTQELSACASSSSIPHRRFC